MKNLNLFNILLLFGLLFSMAIKAGDNPVKEEAGVSFYNGSYEQALIAAQKQQKILFIEFYANWCPHCQKMFRTVLNQEAVGQFYNEHFVNLKVEESSSGARKLMSKFNVSGFPSFIYLDAKTGEIIHRTSGEMAPARFVEEGKTALNPNSQVLPLIQKFQTGDRSPELLKAILDRPKIDHGIKLQAYHAYIDHLNTDSLLQPNNWELMDKYMQDADEAPFSLIMEQRKQFSQTLGVSKVNGFLEKKASALAWNASIKSDPVQLDRSLLILKKINTPSSQEKALRAELNYYNNHDNWDEYFAVGERLIKKYGSGNWSDLNDISWNIALHSSEPVLLHKAEKWTKKSVALNHSFSNVETLAMVEYRLKNMKEAERYALEAIDLGKETHHDYSRTEDLLVKIRQGLTTN